MRLLTIIGIILVVLWLAGFLGFRQNLGTNANLIHVLLVIGIILVVVDLMRGNRARI